ncbi:MAG: UvrD-helicase domain-containing protein [Candidatus Syntrophosphaera sp.]|nr:UvrD-helicase domain-containing protein [Candidatus Syntrophosphaera sp.]
MRQPPLSIITASAGTGKTYRLALEYVRIVLDYYSQPDFSLDNILVLTFTRKATAEIRERIVKHLYLLSMEPAGKEKDRLDLIASLWPDRADRALTIDEKGHLFSAMKEISADRKKLQVMTIDAYIGSIFRNIVRPLRSIDAFEIDQQAIEKRMPYLLDHLMSPKLKALLDNLLRRKVSPSLDEYRSFFTSLINSRWLYYQIDSQAPTAAENSLRHQNSHPSPEYAENCLNTALGGFSELFDLLGQTYPQDAIEKLFSTRFLNLFTTLPNSLNGMLQEVRDRCSRPQDCHKFFRACKAGNIYNGRKLQKRYKEAETNIANTLQEAILLNLANYLVHTLFLPEQQEIMDIWNAILEEYDKLIYSYKNLTYNDIAWFTLEALFKQPGGKFDLRDKETANEFYLFLSHRSRFILIDEFQDTSLMQFSILKPIIEEVISGAGSKDFGGLIVVGDEKQSIFGWRGGERDLLLNLKGIFPTLKNIQVESLDKTYRSSPAMMEFINSIFSFQGIKDYLQERDLNWEYRFCQSAVNSPKYPTQIEFAANAYSNHNKGRTLEEVMNDFVLNSVIPALRSDRMQEIAILCRKGRELDLMQQLLEEAGESGIFQPSNTLPDHAWISPLIAWLRFIAFGDWLDFLEVLRSNYIMLKASPLKQVVDQIAQARENGTGPEFQDVRIAQALYDISRGNPGSPAEVCQEFTDLFLTGKKPTERDFLNIHAFISLSQDFELDRAQRNKSIPAFLDFLDANREQEFLKQVAVEGGNSLQLLTIHKSKGLQFDRVFVFYNLSGKGGSDSKYLRWFVDYGSPDFQILRDYALTYHYEDVLANSSWGGLVAKAADRDLLEEMNTLYVAFTRAKTALHISMAYIGKQDYDEFRDSRKPEQVRLPLLLTDAVRDFFSGKGIEPDDRGRYLYTQEQKDAPCPDKDQVAFSLIDPQKLVTALPAPIDDPYAGVEPNPAQDFQNLKKLWLEDRQRLLGNLAHHYLSFVKFNLPQEHERASAQCLARFGSLLSEAEITGSISNLRASLHLDEIFVPGYDKVFTELTVYHAGKELRLDRLLVDTAGKRALILDYKTGSIDDPLQLERYKAALLGLDVFAKDGYRVDTAYLKLRI